MKQHIVNNLVTLDFDPLKKFEIHSRKDSNWDNRIEFRISHFVDGKFYNWRELTVVFPSANMHRRYGSDPDYKYPLSIENVGARLEIRAVQRRFHDWIPCRIESHNLSSDGAVHTSTWEDNGSGPGSGDGWDMQIIVSEV